MKLYDVVELDDIVKEQARIDKSSPEMYSAIKELAEGVLVIRGLIRNDKELDEISHEAATDLYIKINDEEDPLEIVQWSGYLFRCMEGYVRQYLHFNRRREELVINDPVVEREFVLGLYSSLYPSTTTEELRDVAISIPGMIDEFYDNYTRYSTFTREYYDTKISIKLSIYHESIVVYGSSDPRLVKLLYPMIMKCISSKLLNYYRDIDFNLDSYLNQVNNSIQFTESEWSHGS